MPYSRISLPFSIIAHVVSTDKLLHLIFKVWFSPWDSSWIPSESSRHTECHVIVTYRWVNAHWRVAAGCDISRSLLERHRVAVSPPVPSVLIFCSCFGGEHTSILSPAWCCLSHCLQGDLGSKDQQRKHTRAHTLTCTNTAKSLYQRRGRDGVWIKLPNVERSAKHTHGAHTVQSYTGF